MCRSILRKGFSVKMMTCNLKKKSRIFFPALNVIDLICLCFPVTWRSIFLRSCSLPPLKCLDVASKQRNLCRDCAGEWHQLLCCQPVAKFSLLTSFCVWLEQVWVHASPPWPLGHVAVCRWARLGDGVVPHARQFAREPVHSSGLSPRDGRGALCQQDIRRHRTGPAVGRRQAGLLQQVHLKGGNVLGHKAQTLSSCFLVAPPLPWAQDATTQERAQSFYFIGHIEQRGHVNAAIGSVSFIFN